MTPFYQIFAIPLNTELTTGTTTFWYAKQSQLMSQIFTAAKRNTNRVHFKSVRWSEIVGLELLLRQYLQMRCSGRLKVTSINALKYITFKQHYCITPLKSPFT